LEASISDRPTPMRRIPLVTTNSRISTNRLHHKHGRDGRYVSGA
jgi:hypothetical protein